MKIADVENGLGEHTEINISKLVALDTHGVEMIHLDKLKNGTWRLAYTKDSLPDITLPLVVRIK
jgi:hypothetical protein